MTGTIEGLAWDSDFFGMSVGRASSPDVDQGDYTCLYLLTDLATARRAEDLGWHLMDVRVDLTAESQGVVFVPQAHIRRAEWNDLPALREIAGGAHTTTRFYADPRLNDGMCDELYRQWITNSLDTDTVLVAVSEGEVVGYVTVTGDERLGLIAVAEDARGQGVGSMLVLAATSAGARVVATQAQNVSAMRLFERHGFVTTDVSFWLHRHA